MATAATSTFKYLVSHIARDNTSVISVTAPSADSSNSVNHGASLNIKSSFSPDRIISAISVESLSFVHQLQNIREGSAKIYVIDPTVAAGGYLITLPYGNYSAATFTTSFNAAVAAAQLANGSTLTSVVISFNTITSRVAITNSTLVARVDPSRSDTLLMNMLGFTSTSQYATQPYCLVRDLHVNLTLSGAQGCITNLSNSLSVVNDTIFTLPLTVDFGEVQTWTATGAAVFTRAGYARQTLDFVWTDSRNKPLPYDTVGQWFVSGTLIST